PADRDVVGETLTVGRQHGGVGPDLRMAGHADRRGRHSCVGGLLDFRMTIAAVDSEPADMVLVAEWDRLLRCKSLLTVVSHDRNDPDSQRHKHGYAAHEDERRRSKQIRSWPEHRHQRRPCDRPPADFHDANPTGAWSPERTGNREIAPR